MNYLLRQPWRDARRYYEAGAWTGDTVPGLIRAWAAQAPDRLAVAEPGRWVSYASLAAAMERAAANLAAAGVDRGDAVLVRMPDSAAFVAASAAAHAVQGVAVPVAASAGELEVASIVARVRPRAYAGPAQDWPCLAGLHHLSLADPAMWQPGTPPLPGYEPDPDALMEIMFTSGTTGQAKGVMNSANTKLAGVRGWQEVFGLTPDDVCGLVAPLHHNAGWGYSYLVALQAGASAVVVGRGDPERMLDVLAGEGVTMTFLVPTHVTDLLTAWRQQPGRWKLKLRYVMTGGAGVPAEVVAGIIDEWAAEPIIGYGMTEAQSVLFPRPGDPRAVRTATVGRPCPGVTIDIRSPLDGRPVTGDGATGEVLISGPTVCLGYYDDQAATDAAFTKDGWLRSGDLGEYAGGQVRIVGRIKEVILRGGATIVPGDVEAGLAGCPGVQELAVCGLPDDRLGELICACAVGPATLAELHDYLARRGIGRGLWPDVLVRLDSFPRTALGKIQRAELAALAARHREPG